MGCCTFNATAFLAISRLVSSMTGNRSHMAIKDDVPFVGRFDSLAILRVQRG
jgi:hypothetical protein